MSVALRDVVVSTERRRRREGAVSNYVDLPEPKPEWTRIDFECAFYAVRERLISALESRDNAEYQCGEISARCAEAESALAEAREANERMACENKALHEYWMPTAKQTDAAWRAERERNAKLESELAALRASQTDTGRVERVRESVRWFAEQMERKLKLNDHKLGWKSCRMEYLTKRLGDECGELRRAVVKNEDARVIDEAADVANFAMMIADKVRAVLAAADGKK